MRVCVTGIGCVSGIGLNVEEHLRSFRDGRDGLGAVTLFPTRHEEPVSEVKRTNEALKEQLGIPVSAALSRTALLGMTAAFEALADSGLDLSDRDRPDVYKRQGRFHYLRRPWQKSLTAILF